jgi:hypothetical protein
MAAAAQVFQQQDHFVFQVFGTGGPGLLKPGDAASQFGARAQALIGGIQDAGAQVLGNE